MSLVVLRNGTARLSRRLGEEGVRAIFAGTESGTGGSRCTEFGKSIRPIIVRESQSRRHLVCGLVEAVLAGHEPCGKVSAHFQLADFAIYRRNLVDTFAAGHGSAEGAGGCCGSDLLELAEVSCSSRCLCGGRTGSAGTGAGISDDSAGAAFLQQQIFVHDAAHELKTAVTIIKSSLQLLTSRKRTATEYEHGLELCLSDCARMEDLVQKLLTLARLEQPRQEAVVPAKTDLSECLREVAEQMEPLASMRGVSLVLEPKEGTLACIASDECATLATNLVVNALQHTPSGGSVILRVRTQKTATVFEVEDNGEGIRAEDLPHVFDRFYRGDPSRSRHTGGAGLGLAICRAIAETAGGGIEISSEVGRGTLARVTLPMADAEQLARPLQELLS